MELSTVQRLSDLNRRFYEAHAVNFADSRPRLAPGVQRVLSQIAPGARVLELGCGDGKVGRALPSAAYVGVDQSAAMIQRAVEYTLPRADSAPPIAFVQADLADAAWPSLLPPGMFDWVLAFGVFHHLPGAALRSAVLRQAAGLLGPAGRVVMANWQFTRSERLLRRVRPWRSAGLDAAALEPGDHLLAWERKGAAGLRYVHLLDQAEAHTLAAQAGLTVLDVFASDGLSGDLSDYVTMGRAG